MGGVLSHSGKEALARGPAMHSRASALAPLRSASPCRFHCQLRFSACNLAAKEGGFLLSRLSSSHPGRRAIGVPQTNDLHLIGSSIPQLRYAVSLFHRKMTRHRWASVAKGVTPLHVTHLATAQRCFLLRQFQNLDCVWLFRPPSRFSHYR